MNILSNSNIWKVAYPIIVGSIAQNLINVADTAFLGRLGEIAVGAGGNAIIFYFIFIVFGMGFAIGGEIVVGRRNGEGNLHEIGSIIEHSFVVLILMSLLLFGILKIYAGDVLALVTANPIIHEKSMEYLDFRLYGIFFAYLNLGFRIFYIGTTRTSILTYSTLAMAAVNVIFDYLLIFGKFGFPEMGIKGAAVASVIAEGTVTIYFAIYTLRKVDLKLYGLFEFARLKMDLFKKIFSISAPMMIQGLISISSWMFFFLIIEKMGSRELAISHIVRSIYMVLMIPLFGFYAATNTLVSNLIGMGQIENVIKLTKKVILLTLAITACFLPFNLLIPEQMFSIYTTDVSIIRDGIPVLYVVTGAMFFFTVGFILFSAVSGTGNTRTSLLIEICTLAIYLSSAFTLAITWNSNLTIVWCSEYIYFSMMGILSFLYLRYGNWRMKKI